MCLTDKKSCYFSETESCLKKKTSKKCTVFKLCVPELFTQPNLGLSAYIYSSSFCLGVGGEGGGGECRGGGGVTFFG